MFCNLNVAVCEKKKFHVLDYIDVGKIFLSMETQPDGEYVQNMHWGSLYLLFSQCMLNNSNEKSTAYKNC